jgi:geranyl-CoA carboxylase alpha subunit
MTTIDTILVANRGEIAVRVIKTARALGYATVAVYSEADAAAPHVRLADQAVLIGPPPVGLSYLDGDKIIDAARRAGADAVHPGYGFLSENADFARTCAEAGLIFIGPSPEAIQIMGNKAEAKRRMIAAGVACVPGYEGSDQSETAMIAEAGAIGYPIMVKAAAGGGGRGMRLVEAAEGLPAALGAARSEAENAFGSGELILEKAIEQPRHVEIQVFGDAAGNVIHFGERDCSVQRRHQKVVEEQPCPVMTPELRAEMGRAAVEAAQSIGYVGAGTVEFLLDASGAFYFLEMNTRLQVEHPVTEMVTGTDLVALQFKVAEGKPLGLAQADVTFDGHAIEVRLYAEDPANEFLPSAGHVDEWLPAEGDGIRVDHGLASGQEISPYYDPMIAKIIAWGADRDTARRRLIRALKQTVLFGPVSNKDFLIDVLANPVFAEGGATTAFLDEAFTETDLEQTPPTADQAAVAAVLQYRRAQEKSTAASPILHDELHDWHSAGQLFTKFRYPRAEVETDFAVAALGDGHYDVTSDDGRTTVTLLDNADGAARLVVGVVQKSVRFGFLAPATVNLAIDGRGFIFQNRIALGAGGQDAEAGGRVVAPMHGRIHKVLAAVGDRVEKGSVLAVVEAMKMEHEVTAPVSGRVIEVTAGPDTQVAVNAPLMEIEPLGDD